MKRVLIALCALVLLAVLLSPLVTGGAPEADRYAASGRALILAEIDMPQGTISANSGDLYELMELPGVGEVIGQRIIDERESGGPFLYPEDMLTVSGIGVKTLERFRDMLDMSLPEDDD